MWAHNRCYSNKSPNAPQPKRTRTCSAVVWNVGTTKNSKTSRLNTTEARTTNSKRKLIPGDTALSPSPVVRVRVLKVMARVHCRTRANITAYLETYRVSGVAAHPRCGQQHQQRLNLHHRATRSVLCLQQSAELHHTPSLMYIPASLYCSAKNRRFVDVK